MESAGVLDSVGGTYGQAVPLKRGICQPMTRIFPPVSWSEFGLKSYGIFTCIDQHVNLMANRLSAFHRLMQCLFLKGP